MRTFHVFLRAVLSVTLLLCIFLVPKNVYADPDGMSGRFGANLLVMRYHDKPFYAANIPTLDIGFPIAKRYAQLELGWGIQWGFTKFYVDQFPDFLPSLGLRVYPFGKFFSVYGKGKWGTFIFNNSTVSAEVGGDIDIKTSRDGDDDNFVSIGFGYFTRRVGGLGDFVERDRHDQWYLTSKGLDFRISFLFRTLLDGS